MQNQNSKKPKSTLIIPSAMPQPNKGFRQPFQYLPEVGEMPKPLQNSNNSNTQMQTPNNMFYSYIPSTSNIKSYDQAMQMFETKSVQENIVKKAFNKQTGNDDYYGEDYYGEEEEDKQEMISDPSQLISLLSQMQLNQGQVSDSQLSQIDPQMLQQIMAMAQNQQQQQYNPQYIEDENGIMVLNEEYSQDGMKILTQEEIEANIEEDMDNELIDDFLSNIEKFTPCSYFLKGNCRFGDKCKYLHSQAALEKQKKKNKVATDDSNKIDIFDEECSICILKVRANNKQFGILDGCSHPFCLDCIRKWRSTFDKRISKHHFRTCPICRRNSYLVIPSPYFIRSGDEKDELIQDYKAALKEKDCKHFNKGNGGCPFMNSCLYKHALPDGTLYEYPWKDNKINEYGEWEDDHQQTLSEMFGMHQPRFF